MEQDTERTTDQQAGTGAEQSTDQAAATQPGVEADVQADSSESEAESVELIGQDRFDSLKDDPAALRKELNRAATRKFQEIAGLRKELEPYQGFIQALDADPRAAITAIGKRLGLDIRNAEEKTTEEIAQTADDRITEQVKKHLGPEYEDLADRLAPAIKQVAMEVAKEIAAPLVQGQQEIIQDSALRESKAAIDAFAKANPDWKKHESAMVELSKRLPPGDGMDQQEYLGILYHLATRDASEGDTAKRLAGRMEKNARTVATEARRTTVADGNVSKTPARPPTFREAYEAAKEGRRFE